jgi:hypothetical protein
MGLDVCVYCDCFEKGLLLEAPPAGVKLRVSSDGSLEHEGDDLPIEAWMAFDRWREEPCVHRWGKFIDHRIGNISLVAFLRTELSREAHRFSLLLGKVLYNGCHAGDFIPMGSLDKLEYEVKQLRSFKCARSEITERIQNRWPGFGCGSRFRLPSTTADWFVKNFYEQMKELIHASRQIGKPIVF